jgi:hypothetical protein
MSPTSKLLTPQFLDQAARLQGHERLDGLRERDRPAPVQQVQVQPVRAEPPQAGLAGPGRALAARVVRQHLADQEDLLTPAGDGLTDQYFRVPVRVHLGGVDQVHAGVETMAQRGDL